MPSKSKKQSKSKSRLSKSDASPSPCSLDPSREFGEDELLSCIEEASGKFPSFIGKKPFVGRVSGVDSCRRGCTVRLSEPSMLASGITPLSTVSVSLFPAGSRPSSGFPLCSLTAECSRCFGIDSREEAVNIAGNYFVIATVYSSHKLLKDEVRLCSNLSNSLGCPASGRVVFIHPVQIVSHNCHSSGNDNENSLLSHMCEQLYFKPLLIKNVTLNSPTNPSLGKVAYPFEGSEVSSPQIPSPSQPATSPCINELCLTEGLDGSPGAVFDSLDVKEMLMDETVRGILEVWAYPSMGTRKLLRKNIVALPSFGRLYIFEVLHAEKLSSDNTNRVEDDSAAVFTIDRRTKVSVSLPSDLVSEASKETILHYGGNDYGGRNLNINREVKKLGGLWKEYGILKDIISSPVKNALSGLGLRPPKGVLLYGPPGTGKTSLAQLCAYDAGVNFFKVNGPEVISQYHGESEHELHKVFEAASKAAPAVIFIDELDAIAPARKEGGEELSQRMVATLLNLMDGISRNDGLLIIAATNRIESVEPALRRPGRLDREIEIGVPSAEQRLDILNTHLSSMEHSLQSGEIQHLAVVTHGFVGADLAALCNEAAMVCLRRCIKQETSHNNVPPKGTTGNSCSSSPTLDSTCCMKDWGEYTLEDNANLESTAPGDLVQSPDSVLSTCSGEAPTDNRSDVEDACVNSYVLAEAEGTLMVDFEDFEKAKMRVRPSAMREVMLEVPRVKWEDVGGQEEVKRQLVEAVVWPQKHHDAFKRIGTSPPTGVLLFGPPGCSKTLMARAVASEAGLNFLAVKGPELFSKWVGESEKAVRSLFAKARANAPSIIFFDEIDSLAVTRGRESDGISVADRVMSQLLVELDGLHQRVDVTVIAATNRPDNIDPALLRPGRFDRLLYVGPPNEKDREDIFHIHLRKMPCSSDVDRRKLAHLTEGFTGADISLICRAAAMKALEESFDVDEVKMGHFEAAIKHVRPTETEPFQNLSERFQRLVCSKAEADRSPLSPQLKGSMRSCLLALQSQGYGLSPSYPPHTLPMMMSGPECISYLACIACIFLVASLM